MSSIIISNRLEAECRQLHITVTYDKMLHQPCPYLNLLEKSRLAFIHLSIKILDGIFRADNTFGDRDWLPEGQRRCLVDGFELAKVV